MGLRTYINLELHIILFTSYPKRKLKLWSSEKVSCLNKVFLRDHILEFSHFNYLG
jgi:hypothetical protein